MSEEAKAAVVETARTLDQQIARIKQHPGSEEVGAALGLMHEGLEQLNERLMKLEEKSAK